jgi:hypothetical protein
LAPLRIRQGKVCFDSEISRLDSGRSFELLSAFEWFSQLHQDSAEGFVSFGDLWLQSNDLGELRLGKFQISGLASCEALMKSSICPFD